MARFVHGLAESNGICEVTMDKAHPIHVLRYCPRCGSPEFPATGSRSFGCGNCGFRLFINSAAAVAALIFDREGRLLVTRRAIDPDIGKMDLPGGFVDPDETAEAAVRRELREELGVEVKSLRYLTSRSNQYLFSGIVVFTLDLAFRAEIVNLENMVASDDISAFEWVDPSTVDPAEIPAPSIRYFIREVALHEKSNPEQN